MKTGITGITLKEMKNLSSGTVTTIFQVKWRNRATGVNSIEKAIQKLWDFKKSECLDICKGQSEEWIRGYIVGLIHGEFISEEEGRLADIDLKG